MIEGARFNFTTRRAEKAKLTEEEERTAQEKLAQLRREGRQLAEAISQHFSTGALAASLDGDVVTINKKGTGRSFTIGVVDIGKYKLQAHGGTELEMTAANQSFSKPCNEGEMMDAVEEWSKA
jgi:hypothetical protein